LVGLEPPPRVSCLLYYATAVPDRFIPGPGDRPDKKMMPPGARRGGLRGEVPGSGWLGGWIYPCQGDQEGFSKTRSLRISKRMVFVGWMEPPPRTIK
jgi:hypothetical protein